MQRNWDSRKKCWLCSAYFVSDGNGDDPFSPDFVPSTFSFFSSPIKRKQQESLKLYERRVKHQVGKSFKEPSECSSLVTILLLSFALILVSANSMRLVSRCTKDRNDYAYQTNEETLNY